jgi:hypothetical protein
MPQAVPFLVQYAMTQAAVFTAGQIMLATFASSLLVSSYQQRQAKKAARRAFEASLKDRKEVVRSSTEAKSVIYGKTMVGGVLTYISVTGDTKQFCHMVITIAPHEIEAIDDIFFNDVSIGPIDSNGDVQPGSRYYKEIEIPKTEIQNISGLTYTLDEIPKTGTLRATIGVGDGESDIPIEDVTGKVVTLNSSLSGASGQIVFNYQYDNGFPHVHLTKYLGTQTTADPELVADTDGEWTSDHVGNGQAYIYIRLKYDADIFQTGIPQIKFLVRGKKVFDPRTSTTAYSDNAALCVYDYLRSADGFGCAATEINESLINAAANICDENVSISASETQKRYTINGILSTEDNRLENLENLMLSMFGSAVWSQGKWNIYAGAYRTPSATLTQDDLTNTDAINIQSRANRRDLFNYIKGVYVDPDKSWQVTDFSPIGSPTYVGYDGDETITKDVVFQYVTDPYRAQRLATLILQQSRLALSVSARFNLKAYHLQPGDVINLTMPRYGWSSKAFRIMERSFSPDNGVSLMLKEELSAAYDWSFSELIPIISGEPSANLPTQRAILPPTSLTATSSNATVRKIADGTEIPRLLVQWVPPQDDRVLIGGYIEIEYKSSFENDWSPWPRVEGTIGRVYIEPVQAGLRYDVRIRSLSVSGNVSEWVYAGGVQGQADTTPPGVPTSVTATAGKQSIVLTWVNPTDSDLNVVEIWVNTSATLIGITKVTEISGERFTHDNLPSNATRYYYLRAKDHSGNVSDWASVVSATTQTNLADEIAAAIVNTAAFAAGIRPVEIVDTLPTTGNFEGRMVFLTTDDKLYRHTGSAFTVATDGADIVANSITGGKIQAGAISTDQLAANAVNADKIAAGAVTASKINVTDLTVENLKTSASGQRVEILKSNNDLRVYNSSGQLLVSLGQSGAAGSVQAFNQGGLQPGIYGETTSGLPGVYGYSTGAGSGIDGTCTSSGYGVFGSSASGESIRGLATAAGGGNHGVRGLNTNGNGAGQNTAGLVGAANGYDFYADGTGTNYGPFTGTHDALTDPDDTFEVGDIVIDEEIVERNGISSTISLVRISTQANQAAALGVVCAPPRPLSESHAAVYVDGFDDDGNQVMKPSYEIACEQYNIMAVNSVGEGQMNVCGEGGNISAGDLIVTSGIPGKGMKQSDDVVRSITVAKARESVTFSGSEIKQIACIYLCG